MFSTRALVRPSGRISPAAVSESLARVGPTSSYTSTENSTTLRTMWPSDSWEAVAAMPRATPACGSRVMPRYFWMSPLQRAARLLRKEPLILPAERAMMYTTPMNSTKGLARMVRSSSAPESTKNRMLMGDTQRSRRSISSSEVGQMLQNTVPVIMHTSSREKPQRVPAISNSVMDRPTVSSTNATERLMRLEREWK